MKKQHEEKLKGLKLVAVWLLLFTLSWTMAAVIAQGVIELWQRFIYA